MQKKNFKSAHIEKKVNLFVYIIFSFIPLSFILGNTILNTNILLCSVMLIVYSSIYKSWGWTKNDLFIYLLIIWIYLIFNSLYAIFFKIEHGYLYGGLVRSLGFIKIVFFSCSFFIFKNKNLQFQKVVWFWFLIVCLILFDVFFEKFFGKNLIGNISPDHTRIVSFFKDELVAGSFLFCFGFFSTIYLFINEKKSSFKKNIFFFLIGIIALAIFISGERSNFIKGLIYSLFLFAILPGEKLYVKKKFVIILILISACGFLLFDKNINQKYSEFFDRVKISQNDGFKKFENIKYFSHYKVAVEIFKDNIFFGVGNKNFRWACHKVKYYDSTEKFSLQRCSTHAHQVHLDILSEQGLIGYFLIFTLLAKFVISVIRNFDNDKKHNNLKKSLIIFLLIFMIPILPSGSIFSTFNGSHFWLIISILNYLNLKNKKIYFNSYLYEKN